MVDYADIGKRIRACRLAKGMTQEQLANEVGVVVTHISHIETGNSVPSLKTLIDIINALDCSADELLCIEIKKAKPVFDSWMTEQLADCSADEAKIIKETVVSLKTLIDIINALDCSADELLCIEIKKAKPVFDSWMTEQLADCSADEAKIIKETVVSLKKSLRKVYGKSLKYRYD